MPQIIHLCSSHDSTKTQKPPSATTVALATSQHAKTRLSQPRLLCLSSNSELPYVPKLSLTISCQAEELHHGTPESCVTLTTVPGMQAMQCKSNVYQVHTLGSQAKTGHRHVIKRLRSRGTNTGPEW
ncbi:uncharacterized protein LOC119461624 isoform X2 [Dermacentor silvarum]|uniref:uncharacterized protein LOC119461624 isoform X2 n=1 Tax=Dermacentor silvarum TaxID=543639 RepID=UPI0021019163|nr:uncharacterized protein LOC119461624 isoform X2 [Dermacentor silvarum]